jgi:polyphosphate kinase
MESPIDLTSPELYINRELSWLEFNKRVLAQAEDASLPLLERLRFLCISSGNLDEFFEIRVAGLKQMVELGTATSGPDKSSIEDQLAAIQIRTSALISRQYDCLNRLLLPALHLERVRLLSNDSWTDSDRAWLKNYFSSEVVPVLSPLGLDPARPFPRIQNKSLNFVIHLSGEDAFGRNSELAIVQAPRSLPRVVLLPPTGGGCSLVLLSAIVAEFIADLFPGMAVDGCFPFRVTRNSDLFVDDEEVDDLRRAVEGELAHRRYGDAVRLETSHDCPANVTEFLLQQFELTPRDHYEVPGPVNLNRLSAIYDMVGRTDLKFESFTPAIPENPSGTPDLFAQIRDRDILLHHPFQSFAPVLDFVRMAAVDPHVLAIKQTLYRTSADSPSVEALIAAANAGKDVTVIVELRARFDEEANIAFANRLQEAGVHVMYGVVGYKTHAKMILVVRREPQGLRRYCHLGTGNYHQRTARAYTDYGLLTCNEAIGSDVHEIFLQLTSITRTPTLQMLLQSPFTLQQRLLALVAREVTNARAGIPANIVARMNSLTDPEIIESLYRASGAGVQIDLVIRGVCALRPGVAGVSENIRVRSIIGRFLEHPRVWRFQNGGNAEVYCSSADWMERNFFRRIEVGFPICDSHHRSSIEDHMQLYLSDARDAWCLLTDGSYSRATPVHGQPQSAQLGLLRSYACTATT